MVRAGRVVCISVPMALTVISLILLSIVGLAQTNKSSLFLSDLYLLRLNTTNLSSQQGINNHKPNDATDPADIRNGKIVIYNSYSTGIWNYCAGGGILSQGEEVPATSVAFCTPRNSRFVFDGMKTWGINSTATNPTLGSKVRDGMLAYINGAARAVTPLYIITVICAGLNVIFGALAVASRVNSLFATLSAVATFVFALCFGAVVTAVNFGLEANITSSSTLVTAQIGRAAFASIWLVVTFSLVSILFWALSSCFCSGKDRRRGGGEAEKYSQGPVSSSGYVGMDNASQVRHAPTQSTRFPPQGQHAPTLSAPYQPYR